MSATDSVKQTNHSYNRIQKIYERALKTFVAEHSTVVERDIAPSSVAGSAVVESIPPEVAKYCNKTERTGAQYFST